MDGWMDDICTVSSELAPRKNRFAKTRIDVLENVPIGAGFECFQRMSREEPKKDFSLASA
jgi:hypothetical protein